MAHPESLVLWIENDWRCEFHRSFGDNGRLVVYRGDQLISAETTLAGRLAELRGDVLRQRVLRGNLRADS